LKTAILLYKVNHKKLSKNSYKVNKKKVNHDNTTPQTSIIMISGGRVPEDGHALMVGKKKRRKDTTNFMIVMVIRGGLVIDM